MSISYSLLPILLCNSVRTEYTKYTHNVHKYQQVLTHIIKNRQIEKNTFIRRENACTKPETP